LIRGELDFYILFVHAQISTALQEVDTEAVV